MQARPQQTRFLPDGGSELQEWLSGGAGERMWSMINYGPGNLWFTTTPGIDAAPGRDDCAILLQNVPYSEMPMTTSVRLSVAAQGALTYSLVTNLAVLGLGGGGGGTGGIEEAPLDGELYARRLAAWEAFEPGAGAGGDFVLKTGDTMTGHLQIDFDPIASFALNADQACYLHMLRNDEARWIIGCVYFTQDPYPSGLYIARMNADGTYLDFPFSIRRTDGHCVLHETECEAAYKTGNLDIAAPNEYVTRHFLESSPTRMAVLRTGDTMTGPLTLESAGLIIRDMRPPAFGDAVLRMQANEAALIALEDAGGPRWSIGAAFLVGNDQSFTITRGGPIGIIRDFKISAITGRVEVRGLIISNDGQNDPLRLNGQTQLNAAFAFSENDQTRWNVVAQYANVAKGPGLYFYRMNGATILGECLYISHADGHVEIDTSGLTLRGPLNIEAPSGLLSTHTIYAPGVLQFFRDGIGRWYFGTGLPFLTPPVNDLCIYRSDTLGAPNEIALKIASGLGGSVEMTRPTTTTGDPTGVNELTRKAYVDALVATGAEGAMPLTGLAWTPGQSVRYRVTPGGRSVQFYASLRNDASFPAGTVVELGTLPAAVRPIAPVQNQICGCSSSNPTPPTTADELINYGFLLLSNGGQLQFYPHVNLYANGTIWINHTFALDFA
jgi:hypothetical protein